MARIRCKYIGCTLLDNGICSATTVELDPDEGCLTFSVITDPFEDDDWDDEDDMDGYEEWDDDDDLNNAIYEDNDF
jgi:hypothetical protein